MEDNSKYIKQLDMKQNAIKILINSIYGASANNFFYFYDRDIAQSITLQGQDLIKFSIKAANHYFKEKWHKDVELHKILGIDIYKINQVLDESVIYGDTDSVAFNTIINSKKYGKISIEEWYKLSEVNGSAGNTLIFHESVITNSDDAILNWTNSKDLHYSSVKRIIRHRVTKDRWKLTTFSGKSIIVTGDHSLIIFRDNIQLEIKAKDINIETDLILSMKD